MDNGPIILNRKICTSYCNFDLSFCFVLLFVFKVLENWSPKLSHENDGLIFNPAEEVD